MKNSRERFIRHSVITFEILLLIFLAACKNNGGKSETYSTLVAFCSDPANFTNCAVDESEVTWYSTENRVLIFHLANIIVRNSSVVLSDENGNCDFPAKQPGEVQYIADAHLGGQSTIYQGRQVKKFCVTTRTNTTSATATQSPD